MIAWWWLIPVGLACFGLGIAVTLMLAVIFAATESIRAGKDEDA